ncbi:MAG: transposase [Brevefilum sp.]|nr:transposase [Brevefilum sp.]
MSHLSKGFHSPEVEQYLKRARATAMILIHDDMIIAKYGRLSPEGFQEFADAVQRHWLGWEQGDLDRQVVLSLDGQFHCLRVRTTPSGDYLLSLAFPMEISLKHMRREMEGLMRLVTVFDENTGSADDRLEQSLQLTGQPTSKPVPPETAKTVPEGWQIENKMAGQIEDEIVPEEPLAPPGAPENKFTGEEQESQPDGLRWQPLDALLPSEVELAEAELDVDQEIDHRVDHLTAQLGDQMSPLDDDLVSIIQDADQRQRSQNALKDRPSITYHDPFPDEPYLGSCDEDTKTLEETVMDTTFYLVPRLKDHYLLGELALHLREWFPALCEIYGWELASLSVRPDYLKWTLLDFPECLIRDLLGVVRHWTSERIFNALPDLQAGNSTQDFWSPGYLVDTQNREFPTQVLVTHISRSRVTQESLVD